MSIFSPIRLLVRKASPIPGLVGLRLALEQEVAARFDAHSGFNGWRMAEYLKDQGEMRNGSLAWGFFFRQFKVLLLLLKILCNDDDGTYPPMMKRKTVRN